MTYRVNTIYQTIQGEGQQAGRPMILIRLHGCRVGCTFCDTKETWHAIPDRRVRTLKEAQATPVAWWEADAATVAEAAHNVRRTSRIRWALLTGGEPAEQDLPPLVHALHERGFFCALETSGTARGHLAPNPMSSCDFVCVSPKWDNPNGLPVLDDVVTDADEVKVVIGKAADIDRLKTEAARIGILRERISVQPMSQSTKATALCLAAALAEGWRVSIQTHKLVGVA